MSATELGTFWLLYGSYGVTMTLEQIRDQFYPKRAMRTMQNHLGEFPPRVGDVFDTRTIADWWDEQLKRAA